MPHFSDFKAKTNLPPNGTFLAIRARSSGCKHRDNAPCAEYHGGGEIFDKRFERMSESQMGELYDCWRLIE